MTLPVHRLRMTMFDALATHGGRQQDVFDLRNVGRSRRLALLRAVLDREGGSAATGPLPPLSDAWTLVVAAERTVPSSTEWLVGHVHLGVWAVDALRRLHDDQSADDTPLWVVLGYLHACAAAAAIMARLPVRLAVPARDGKVVLPSLGFATIPGGAGWYVAEVTAVRGVITIAGPAGRVNLPTDLTTVSDVWQPIRRLRTTVGGHGLDIPLDDVDPYRMFISSFLPEPVGDAEYALWRQEWTAVWDLLTTHHPHLAEQLAAGLTALVPVASRSRFTTFSASSSYAFGCVNLSRPLGPADFAATLVHELRHSILVALLELVDLYRDQSDQLFYAPWRDDPRPLPALLHGAFSFSGVTQFWRAQRSVVTGASAALANFEFAYWRQQTAGALATLQTEAALTELGQRFVGVMADQHVRWADEVVPSEIATAARLASTDHYATWRLHHLRPDQTYIGRLVRAWSTGEEAPSDVPPEPILAPTVPSAARLRGRTILHRLKLSDPVSFEQRRTAPHSFEDGLTGLTAADADLVGGDCATAADRYRAELADDATRPGSWVGLGLALNAGKAQPDAAAALLRRPEIVRAVYAQLAIQGEPPDVSRLAAWIGASAVQADQLQADG